MNIDEMPAGREMDILIAEQVFKVPKPDLVLRLSHRIGCRDYDELEPFYNQHVWITCWRYREGRELPGEWKPKAFSTDITAAWPILENLQSAYGIAIVITPNGLIECSLVIDNREYTAQANTAPLAICRAALKAVAKPDP